MLTGIGVMLLFVASMMGDSDNLIMPFVLIMVGASLVILDDREEADNGKESITKR